MERPETDLDVLPSKEWARHVSGALRVGKAEIAPLWQPAWGQRGGRCCARYPRSVSARFGSVQPVGAALGRAVFAGGEGGDGVPALGAQFGGAIGVGAERDEQAAGTFAAEAGVDQRIGVARGQSLICLLYTSPSPRD